MPLESEEQDVKEGGTTVVSVSQEPGALSGACVHMLLELAGCKAPSLLLEEDAFLLSCPALAKPCSVHQPNLSAPPASIPKTLSESSSSKGQGKLFNKPQEGSPERCPRDLPEHPKVTPAPATRGPGPQELSPNVPQQCDTALHHH